jgi:hypothetical protein
VSGNCFRDVPNFPPTAAVILILDFVHFVPWRNQSTRTLEHPPWRDFDGVVIQGFINDNFHREPKKTRVFSAILEARNKHTPARIIAITIKATAAEFESESFGSTSSYRSLMSFMVSPWLPLVPSSVFRAFALPALLTMARSTG